MHERVEPVVNRLKKRKSDIETRIRDELRRPMPDGLTLQRLKRLRLALKDRITQLIRNQSPIHVQS